MSDAILSNNLQKAALSFAYIAAVAARAGYSCDRPYDDVDSVDANIRAGGDMRPQLDVQLKATAVPTWKDDGLHFQLSKKNYDDLRMRRLVPIILVVFELPSEEKDWMACSKECLVLRHSAWWLSLFEYPEIQTDTRIVKLPKNQRLEPSSLTNLMVQVREGEL